MISFKGILKYSIYLFIAGWMFLLGIMVGRGNSPVTFDTQKFQQRLETIAGEFGEKKLPEEKIELKFYDVLDQPVQETGVKNPVKNQEISPVKLPDAYGQAGMEKTSLKKKTFKGRMSKSDTSKKQPVTAGTKKPAAVTQKKTAPPKKTTPPPGRYTIQVAAYKAFKDAVTQMAILEKKGFPAYRVKGTRDGVTWYRVRTGSFATLDEAKKYKLRLEKAKIKSMILKKESHENNKG